MRIVRAVLICVCVGFLAGCSIVKNETKTDKKKKEHKVSILGIGIWHTEKPVEKSGK